MAPGQSTEELRQQRQATRAGEDEERGRGCSRSRLPAAAGKEAGAECQLLGLGENGPAKPSHSRDVPSQFLTVQEPNI